MNFKQFIINTTAICSDRDNERTVGMAFEKNEAMLLDGATGADYRPEHSDEMREYANDAQYSSHHAEKRHWWQR